MAFSVTAQLKNNPKISGKFPLYLVVIIDSKVKRFALDLDLLPSEFNKSDQKIIIKGNSQLTKDYNLILNQQKARANHIAINFRLQERNLTLENFTNAFISKGNNIGLKGFILSEIETLTSTMEPGTIESYNYTLNNIDKFKPNATLYDVDLNFIEAFDGWMANKGNKTNTKAKHHKNLKMFLNRAFTKKMIGLNPYFEFKIKKSPGTRQPLTQLQVKSLMEIFRSNLLNRPLQNSLGQFLFSCIYGGMRFGDAQTLGLENIVDNQLIFLPIKTKKFGKMVRLPLSTYGLSFFREIIKNKFYPITNQYMNRNLNIIAKLAEIDQHITYHVSRHTFATIFLEKGGSIEVLMDILGISKMDTVQVYVKIAQQRKSNQMELMSDLLV